MGRTFASINNYNVDGNKEMMAIGVMNMAGSCASCYVTTGSFSRSAVNYSAGCRTAVSNIVMAATVLITLLFLMPLFHYTPNVILSAIIITAVAGLIDVRGAAKLWKVDKLDFCACVAAFLGVLLMSDNGCTQQILILQFVSTDSALTVRYLSFIRKCSHRHKRKV